MHFTTVSPSDSIKCIAVVDLEGEGRGPGPPLVFSKTTDGRTHYNKRQNCTECKLDLRHRHTLLYIKLHLLFHIYLFSCTCFVSVLCCFSVYVFLLNAMLALL